MNAAQKIKQHHYSSTPIETHADGTGETFEDFFQHSNTAQSTIGESYAESDDGEFYEESAFPEYLESDPAWEAIHHAGYDYIDIAREAFAEIADADDASVDQFIFEYTENMTEEEYESFWSGLANFGRKALRVAAPVIQSAAPAVGSAIGAAFGGVGAPIGGVIGNLVGSGVGALNQHVNGPGRPSRRRPTRSRRRPVSRRRVQRRRVRPTRSRRRYGGRARSGVGRQLVNVMRNPQIQSALSNAAARGVGAIVGAGGESMSEAAVMTALVGGLRETLREVESAGFDLEAAYGDYSPADFETAEEAFDALVTLLDEDA